MRASAHGIKCNRALKGSPCIRDLALAVQPQMLEALQHMVICRQIVSWCPHCSFATPVFDSARQSRDNCSYDFVLNCEDVIEFTIIALRPQMAAALRLDKLRRDANSVACLTHASFNKIFNAKLASYVLRP